MDRPPISPFWPADPDPWLHPQAALQILLEALIANSPPRAELTESDVPLDEAEAWLDEGLRSGELVASGRLRVGQGQPRAQRSHARIPTAVWKNHQLALYDDGTRLVKRAASDRTKVEFFADGDWCDIEVCPADRIPRDYWGHTAEIGAMWHEFDGTALPAASTEIQHIGYPGRPSKGRGLIAAELARRVAAGEEWNSKRSAAIELLDWFRERHGDCEPPSVNTILNNHREQIPLRAHDHPK